MYIIPAIDLINGQCVRLTQGDFAVKKVYHDDPIAVAKSFQEQGAKWLHVVDLDGAKAGHPVNRETISAIVEAVEIPVQVGGGMRVYAHARDYLENGVERVIIGTAAVADTALVKRLLEQFGARRIAVSVDTKGEQVLTHGWLENSAMQAMDFAQRLYQSGVRVLVVTATERDGLLQGPDFEQPARLASIGFEVIAAGGVSSTADAMKLARRGVMGAIVGKAMYERAFDLPATQAAVEPKSGLAKRIIPCLDVKDGRVVKGTHFRQLRDIGDPVELAHQYSTAGADELVFLDITATVEGRDTFKQLVTEIARQITIPFTVGGGISSIDNIRALLQAGADKISIGSAAVTDKHIVSEAARYFGSQCIVISLDAKRDKQSWKVYIKGGSERTEVDALEFARAMEDCGAGEILVNSLDRDGTKAGFDLELLGAIVETTNLPIIASSGAGSAEDFATVFEHTGVDAALGASVFHFGEISVVQLKQFLSAKGLTIRL